MGIHWIIQKYSLSDVSFTWLICSTYNKKTRQRGGNNANNLINFKKFTVAVMKKSV